MPTIPLREMLAATGIELRGALAAETEFRWIERNSRKVQPGDCFIAVTGERFDGHQFVADAAAHGAAAALVRREWADAQSAPPLPLLVVDDPVTALQSIAAARRDALGLTVVGITGSIGKTSTKEVVAAVLGERFATFRSPGNMNSELGLPLSLLEIEPGTEVAVLEMGGAYAFGELALLARIAKPRYAIVTNVHPVHLERMGTIEAIAETKAELVDAVPEDGAAILNGDDERVRAMAPRCRGRVITYGLDPANEIWADRVETDGLSGSSFRLHLGGESLHLKIPLVGGHAVELALAAIATGHAMGLDIAEMILGFDNPGIQVRLLLIEGPNESRLLDDTYNASAPSVLSALGLLRQIRAERRIAVLGDMRELGAVSEAQHRVVGRRAAEIADLLITFGETARIIAEEAAIASGEAEGRPLQVVSFGLEQRAEIVAYLLSELRAGDVALLKGSRGLEMEEFVRALQDARLAERGGMTAHPLGGPVAAAMIGSVMPKDPSQNMAVSLALGGLAFVVTLILGRPIVTFLRIKKMGDKIREEGPKTHLTKTGTPTMGGAMVALSVVILTAVFNLAGRLSMLLPIGILLAAGSLGAIDDRIKLNGGQVSDRRGMTARFKFTWLAIFAIVTGCILHFPDPWGLGLHHIYVPFFGRYNIGLFYLPIAVFAIVAMSKAVNLTDGLDTLAAGLAAIAFVAYGIIAYQQGQVGVVTFCFTMVGSLMGFLWFNAHPAQVFMGDTGSLAIGAALATAAFMTGQWLLLPVVGFVFLAETLSVTLQVGYFKWTKRRTGEGRRLFKMTPLHHHFEILGWSETQVTMRFWIIGMMAGLIGIALALL